MAKHLARRKGKTEKELMAELSQLVVSMEGQRDSQGYPLMRVYIEESAETTTWLERIAIAKEVLRGAVA